MKTDSGFFFTGATVLAGMFFLFEAWAMLPFALLASLIGLVLADREQLAGLDAEAAAMFLAHNERPLLSPEAFSGRALVGDRSGCPVYRYLHRGQQCWTLLGPEGEVKTDGHCIRVFPGLMYRRSDS